MDVLKKFLSSNPHFKFYQSIMKEMILEDFSFNIENFNNWNLVYFDFIKTPFKYHNIKIINSVLDLFENNKDLTLEALSFLNGEITHSIMSLFREGSSWENEKSYTLNDPKDITEFEKIWHPEYQRYCEHIYNHLIRVPLYILGKLENKDFLSLTLSNRVEKLREKNLFLLTEGYNSIVRNAISHGTIFFGYDAIKYTDHKKAARLTARDFLKLFDELVDTCNSVLLALLKFICKNKIKIIERGLKKLPLGIRFLFLKSFCFYKDFKIITIIESEIIGNKKQLNVFCKTNNLSRSVQLFNSLSTAYNIVDFGGEEYDRLAIIIDCNKPIAPTIFIDAKRMSEAIQKNESISCLSQIIEANLLWFDISKIKQKVFVWRSLFQLVKDNYKRIIIREKRKRGMKVFESNYEIKLIENKSTDKIRRINAHICLKGPLKINIVKIEKTGEIRSEIIENILEHCLKCLRKHKINLLSIDGNKGFKRKSKYIWINMYIKDERIRTFLHSGWERKIIARGEWFSKWGTYGPIMVKKPNNSYKKILIEYNPEIQKGRWEN